ncbi:MAG TPA: terminase family protein, partial [Candidatus Absconditabacterales bacterium]|nr:terminase family protein [Candidatus Absconditabacterales bacterium]
MQQNNEIKRELIKRELSLRLLSYFVPKVDPFYGKPGKEYIFKPFHKIMTDALERALKGECKRIMISVPPQHGKSTISTQRFPLFAHLQDPTLNIVSASYSGDLAKSHLGKIRQIVESPQFKVLGKPLNLIKNDSQEYQLKEGGSYYSVGVGGGLTGRPIDIGIIDDVHKDRAEYESDTIRNGVWDWYSSVFQSRLHKDSIIIGVMTRWGEDDLFGRILNTEGDKWEIINIPVYNESETDTIFPERFPLEFMKEKQNSMIPRDFQSLYMGDPINEGGGSFKKDYFMEYENPPP